MVLGEVYDFDQAKALLWTVEAEPDAVGWEDDRDGFVDGSFR